MKKLVELPYFWAGQDKLLNRGFVCGFCSHQVSSTHGFGLGHSNNQANTLANAGIYICPNCWGPNFFTPLGEQIPGQKFGRPVNSVPPELNSLYEEARLCTSANCYTAAVLLCRKMLMNIAVNKKAKEGLKFAEYVDYLANNNYITPDGKEWVDHIRKKGNIATHEIAVMTREDAEDLVNFVEMLLVLIYQFPAKVRKAPPQKPTT